MNIHIHNKLNNQVIKYIFPLKLCSLRITRLCCCCCCFFFGEYPSLLLHSPAMEFESLQRRRSSSVSANQNNASIREKRPKRSEVCRLLNVFWIWTKPLLLTLFQFLGNRQEENHWRTHQNSTCRKRPPRSFPRLSTFPRKR